METDRGEAVRVSDVDLKVGGRDVEPRGAHIRPVWETRDLLLGCRSEAEPLELRADGVPHAVVAPGPCPRVPLAGVSVIAFRVVPAAPHLEIRKVRWGSPQLRTRSPLCLQRQPEPESDQYGVFGIQETQAILRGRDGEPHGGPNSGAGLNPHPIRRIG